jgi:hypothetical protein
MLSNVVDDVDAETEVGEAVELVGQDAEAFQRATGSAVDVVHCGRSDLVPVAVSV